MDEDTVKSPQKHPSPERKSIKINTVPQPRSRSNNKSVTKPRRSILKNGNKSISEEESTSNQTLQMNGSITGLNSTEKLSSPTPNLSRPHNIQELVQHENLNSEIRPCTLDFEDICDSEDIWIVTLPKLIDPQELRGQTISLGDKSKFKIKDERYCTIAQETNYNVTCVFKTGKELLQYKTVNIKPTGSLTIRRKLPRAAKVEPVCATKSDVQILGNLKTRHPLISVTQKHKKRTRKLGSLKREDEIASI